MSAKIRRNTGSWLPTPSGGSTPAFASAAIRPTALSNTVLPPVLGPLVTRGTASPGSARSNGTPPPPRALGEQEGVPPRPEDQGRRAVRGPHSECNQPQRTRRSRRGRRGRLGFLLCALSVPLCALCGEHRTGAQSRLRKGAQRRRSRAAGASVARSRIEIVHRDAHL